MIYMWFTGINYYKLAVEKDRDSIFTTITTISRDAGKGGRRGHRPPCPLVRGQGGGGESALIDKNSNPKKMRYND
jgi:hypothetical protein